jgi:hypothetical protein
MTRDIVPCLFFCFEEKIQKSLSRLYLDQQKFENMIMLTGSA